MANLKVFQNTDLRFNKSYLSTSGGGDGNDVTFPGGERAPSSLHTTRKVAQKDPIFPPQVNPKLTLHTTTRCKRNINYEQYKNSQI